jgi:hypothetical protein
VKLTAVVIVLVTTIADVIVKFCVAVTVIAGGQLERGVELAGADGLGVGDELGRRDELAAGVELEAGVEPEAGDELAGDEIVGVKTVGVELAGVELAGEGLGISDKLPGVELAAGEELC